jgi:hypothetical protein
MSEEADNRSDQEPRGRDDELPLVTEERLAGIEAEDVDLDKELGTEEFIDTQHGDGHTYNPQQAADQGLTYTPPSDPPTVPSEERAEGVEIAAGFAPSMEDTDPDAEALPPHVDAGDLEIEEDAQLALRYNSETAHLTGVQVRVREGIAGLFGTVESEDDLARVYSVVGDLEGVVRVESFLRVRAGP